MKTLIVAFALSVIISLSARAELKWEQTEIELHPTPADKQAIGHFKYQNPGKTPVHFKSVHASCGCTTAQTQKDEVPPGGTGEITATFNIHSSENCDRGDRRSRELEDGPHAQDDYPAAIGDHPDICFLETRRQAGHEDDHCEGRQRVYRKAYQGHVIESGFSNQGGGKR